MQDEDAAKATERDAAHTVRLPRFIVREPVGVGRVVKRVTSLAGVKPCEGCERRAEQLDRWLRVEPRKGGRAQAPDG